MIAMQAPSASPAQPTYLSRSDVVSDLVDGQLWTMRNGDGRNGRIRWTGEGNTFCMRMGFMLSTRCFQAACTSDGFQDYTDGRASVRFAR
jgi:hypothetical protein